MADPVADPIPIRFEQGVSGETERVIGVEEGDNCSVCFEPTSEKSTQLFLYSCRCVYFVHEACFRQWRQQTRTNRVCLICREGLESFENEEDDGEAAPLLRVRRLRPHLHEIPIRAVYYPIVQAPAPGWFWAINTEQKMLLVAVACFILVFLLHLRHSHVVVYTHDETLLLAA